MEIVTRGQVVYIVRWNQKSGPEAKCFYDTRVADCLTSDEYGNMYVRLVDGSKWQLDSCFCNEQEAQALAEKCEKVWKERGKPKVELNALDLATEILEWWKLEKDVEDCGNYGDTHGRYGEEGEDVPLFVTMAAKVAGVEL